MASRRRPSPEVSRRIESLYVLLFFFAVLLVVKVLFGTLAGSKALVISGIMALFGVFIVAVTLLRVHEAAASPRSRLSAKFSSEKTEFVIIAGVSIMIALSTAAVLVSVVHITLAHTLYPPELMAAWVAVVTAVMNIAMLKFVRLRLGEVDERDVSRVLFLLHKGFIVSVLVVAAVVFSRSGFVASDYLLAILEGIFIIGYSAFFLKDSFKGLMDAACDPATMNLIQRAIKKADAASRLDELKVGRVGTRLDIFLKLRLSPATPLRQARILTDKIRQSLASALDVPHETHIGFSPW
ncbi:MAG: hypothetical protein HQL11_04175 [Candidatus Omnitrophica bacterium]|nr:hypothetical protein [Candidatus Omnitrophota bacterium]